MESIEEAFGPRVQISPEDATKFYLTTGIDITGYLDQATKCGLTCPKYYCAAVIQYLKEMEEFMSLSLKDRITVLQGMQKTDCF